MKQFQILNFPINFQLGHYGVVRGERETKTWKNIFMFFLWMAPKNTSIYAYMAEENNSYLFISATVNCFQIQYKCSYDDRFGSW